MKPIVVLLAALALAGCGADSGGTPAGGPEPGGTTETSRPPGPPAVVLVSAAGTQTGVRGSSCIQEEGSSRCLDSIVPVPKEVTVVHPGDRVTFRLVGAEAVRAESCHARDRSCIGQADVTVFGCERGRFGQVFLERGAETVWTVGLPPGLYGLQVFVYFEKPNGATGDVQAALGLRVKAGGERRVVPAPDPAGGCR